VVFNEDKKEGERKRKTEGVRQSKSLLFSATLQHICQCRPEMLAFNFTTYTEDSGALFLRLVVQSLCLDQWERNEGEVERKGWHKETSVAYLHWARVPDQ
jgi:hypothetical protein